MSIAELALSPPTDYHSTPAEGPDIVVGAMALAAVIVRGLFSL